MTQINNRPIVVDFIVVVFNDIVDTRSLCISIDAQIRINNTEIKLYLADNSENEVISLQLNELSREYNFIKYYKTPKNLGYFGAFNYILKIVNFNKSDFVLLCNNDLVFESNFISLLKKINYSKDCYVICPSVISFDGREQNPHVLKKYSLIKRIALDLYFSCYPIASIMIKLKILLNKFRYGKDKIKNKEYKDNTEVHMGIGACYILTRYFFEKNKMLEYPHFLYGEEAYLTNQVHISGGKLFYFPSLRVRHKESATLSKLPSKTTYRFARAGYREYRRFY